MTRSISIACILLLFCAQESIAQFRWGIQGGVNIAGQNIDRLYDLGLPDDSTFFFPDSSPTKVPRVSPNLGIYGEYIVIPDFSIQTGLFYSAKGVRFIQRFVFVNSGVEGRKTVTAQLNYVEVPVSLVLRIPFPQGHLRIGGGAYAAYALSGTLRAVDILGGEKSTLNRTLNLGTDLTDDLNPLDYGITADIGFEFYPFIVSASFRQGFEIGNENAFGSQEYIRNQVLSISATYLLPYGQYKTRKVKSYFR